MELNSYSSNLLQSQEDETSPTEESLYDLDYIVKRPPDQDSDEDDDDDDEDDDDDLPECDFNADHGGEGEQVACAARRNLTPYKKYKKYKSWTRRPLLVIIIGGWVYYLSTSISTLSTV